MKDIDLENYLSQLKKDSTKKIKKRFNIKTEIIEEPQGEIEEDENEIVDEKALNREIAQEIHEMQHADALSKIDVIPKKLAIQTLDTFQGSFSMLPDKIKDTSAGVLVMVNEKWQQEKEYLEKALYDGKICIKDMEDKKKLIGLDISALRMIYSIIFEDIKEELEGMNDEELVRLSANERYITTPTMISVKNLEVAMGVERPNQACTLSMLSRIRQLGSITGCLVYNGYPQFYLVLTDVHYDGKKDTITFICPYGRALAIEIMRRSITKENREKLLNEKLRKPRIEHEASHSYLINSDICNEKNKRAVEIVMVLVRLIEKAGNNKPHMSVENVIKHCTQLRYDYEIYEAGLDKNGNFSRIIKTAFKRAGELLKTKTRLYEKYKDLEIPDLSNIGIKNIKMSIEIRHKGKDKTYEDQ